MISGPWQLSDLAQNKTPHKVSVLPASMANATKPRPTIAAYVELSGFVGKGVAQVLQGGAAPTQQALDEAVKQADQALADS